MRKTIALFSTIFCSIALSAQQTKVLWIGNSYTGTNNLPSLFYNLALSGGDTIIFDSNTPGGYTFQGHSTNATTLQKIAAQEWDYVVLQAQSQEPSFPPSQVEAQTYPYARALDSLIQLSNACTETVFFMTWGRKYGDSQNCAIYPPICTFEGMNARLWDSYKAMADDNRGIVSPVGIAWKRSRAADSTINLWSADNSHPSAAGSYLSACVFYATLLGKNPVGLSYTAGLTANEVAFLQQIARETVQDSLQACNIGRWQPNADFDYTTNDLAVTFTASSDAAQTYFWDFGDGTQEAGSIATHAYASSGSYEVTLFVSDICGNSDTLSQTIDLFVANAQNGETTAWRIFPNPSTRDIMLQAEKPTSFRIEVYGPDGKRLKEFHEFGKLIRLDFGFLAPGMYQIHCHSATDSKVFRIVRE
jgi:hypothetical protein